MARIHELLRQLRLTNAALADDLEREVDVLGARRAFGLNFERHTPEAVELPGRPVRTGDKVHMISPRGQAPKAVNSKLWRVVAIEGKGSERIATLEPYPPVEPLEASTTSVADLVVVAEFRDPIYPGIVSTGKVERGGDKPFHTVINGENYHALQTLLFTHRGKVDAIYIDPPYNTGAKDWKYNNDYVESDDLYRHSKWLAFMERRLLLAKELLDPDGSVLIVTIDEKEYLRLGLLLQQTFPEATIQMVSSQINPKGTGRANEFNRVDEYLFFAWQGEAKLGRLPSDVEGSVPTVVSQALPWDTMRRRNLASVRGRTGPGACGPNQFYAIHVDMTSGHITGRGQPLPVDFQTAEYNAPAGTIPVFPIREDGTEMNWSLTDSAFDQRWSRGYVRAGRATPASPQRYLIQYLTSSSIAALEGPTGILTGRAPDGSVEGSIQVVTARIPRTQWTMQSHNSEHYGTALLKSLLGGRGFPFPKSLYAVEDALRLFLSEKIDATIVDFFAGSGTTAHAVFRLNKQDGGRRVSISVTNNEVSVDEQRAMRARGLRAGDPEWEQWGICDFVTKPRIRAAITGSAPDNQPLQGDYKFSDVFPMADGFEENVEFLSLTYEAPLRIRANRDFEKVAPLLWLHAGSSGRRIQSLSNGWDVAESYGVMGDLDKTDEFLRALATAPGATTVFIITDDDGLFEGVVAALPDGVEPVRLYDAYFRNFEIDAMRGVR